MQRLADTPAIPPSRVLELKAEASSLKQSAGIKQSAALARIAQREGFTSWERLVARAGGADALREEKQANPTEAKLRSMDRAADRKQRFGAHS